MKAIFPWTLLSALVLVIIVAIKPITISLIESYTSLFLNNTIKVKSLSFLDTKLSLHVEDQNNTLKIKILNFSPILIDVKYSGDISTFKKYHPLKGYAKVEANILYDDKLTIIAKTKLYNSNTNFKLNYSENNLSITTDIQDLDLDEFEKQNKDLGLSGKLNATISLHNDDFKILTKLNLPYLDKTNITLNGTYTNTIKANMNLKFKDKEINFEHILYDGEKLSLKTNYLKTPLYLSLLDNRLSYKISNLELSEIFHILKKDEIVKGFVNISGKTNLRTLKSHINLDSKKLSKNNIDFNALHVEAIADLNKTTFDLNLALKNKPLEVNGEISYEKDIEVQLFSRNFDSKSSFYFSNHKFLFLSKHLNMQRFQEAFNLKKEVFADVDLEAKGTFQNISFKINSTEVNIPKISTFTKPFLLSMSGKYYKNKIYFTPYIKNKNYILSRGKNIYNLKTKTLKLQQQLILREKKQLIPIHLTADIKLSKPYEAKAHIGKEKSIANMDLALNKTYLFVKFKKLKLVTIDNFIDKNMLFDKGFINGDITYNLQTKTATSNVVVYDAILNGMDLDRSLKNLEDALGLNVVSLGRNMINNYEYTTQKTYIKQLQLNTYFDHGIITLDDVALSTNKFRIATFGNIKKDGTINKLTIDILDKNGCALISQDLSGNITNPKPKSTSTAIVGVATAIPSALLGTGKKIINFGAKTVDGVATYALEKSYIRNQEISFTSNIVNKSESILKSTSDIVLPNECKVVYDGKVKHPIQKQKK